MTSKQSEVHQCNEREVITWLSEIGEPLKSEIVKQAIQCRDDAMFELGKELSDAMELLLADEQTIRNLEKELQFYKKFVDEIDKAFERNKNFMWGNGKWSVISKTRKALHELKERSEL